MIGAGYLSVRYGLFDAAGIRVLGGYVVNLALPALIFSALTTNDLAAILDSGFCAVYLAGSLAACGLAYLWSRRVTGLNPRTRAPSRAWAPPAPTAASSATRSC